MYKHIPCQNDNRPDSPIDTSVPPQHRLAACLAAVGLSSDAAAIALRGNNGPAGALERLETGHGVIAGGRFEQSDLPALEDQYPDLARSSSCEIG